MDFYKAHIKLYCVSCGHTICEITCRICTYFVCVLFSFGISGNLL